MLMGMIWWQREVNDSEGRWGNGGTKALDGKRDPNGDGQADFQQQQKQFFHFNRKKTAYICVGSVGFEFYKITPFINMYTKISHVK